MTQAVLLCDVSRGHSAFAALCAPGERPETYDSFPISNADDFETALGDFLARRDNPELTAVAISAPGWETGGIQEMPNHGYSLRRDRLREFLHVRRIHMVNSGVARALSVPRLKTSEFEKLFGGEGEPEAVKGVIGIGRGLGMASLVADDLGRWIALAGEGGHCDLPAVNDREAAVIKVMETKFGHVSRERAASVPGLSEIYRCLCVIDGRHRETPTPEAVVELARRGDVVASEAVGLCTGWVASIASDAALMLGARGGIYLTGPLFDLLGNQFDRDRFHQRFCDKGRLSRYLGDVPTCLVTADHPEIVGLTSLFD